MFHHCCKADEIIHHIAGTTRHRNVAAESEASLTKQRFTEISRCRCISDQTWCGRRRCCFLLRISKGCAACGASTDYTQSTELRPISCSSCLSPASPPLKIHLSSFKSWLIWIVLLLSESPVVFHLESKTVISSFCSNHHLLKCEKGTERRGEKRGGERKRELQLWNAKQAAYCSWPAASPQKHKT